jgi:hypothetical protein
MKRSDIYAKKHQLSDAELIKILQFQGDDDGEADSLSAMVEEEIARRKAGGGSLPVAPWPSRIPTGLYGR